MAPVLEMWRKTRSMPFGKRLFTRAVSMKAPYFATIPAQFEVLEPGRSEVTVKNTRKVHNHLGTVHAIASCNAAELSAGIMAEVTVPRTHRWIPVGMTVQYLHKAETDVRAFAEAQLPEDTDERDSFDWTVPVRILDDDDVEVVHVDITMHVSRKPAR